MRWGKHRFRRRVVRCAVHRQSDSPVASCRSGFPNKPATCSSVQQEHVAAAEYLIVPGYSLPGRGYQGKSLFSSLCQWGHEAEWTPPPWPAGTGQPASGRRSACS